MVKARFSANPKELCNLLQVSDRILGEHKHASQALPEVDTDVGNAKIVD
jgi:hypothetical protein